jgi:hypothetical protein
MPMMTTTIRSSMSVKPLRMRFMIYLVILGGDGAEWAVGGMPSYAS